MESAVIYLLLVLLLIAFSGLTWVIVKLKKQNKSLLEYQTSSATIIQEQQSKKTEIEQLLREKQELIGVVSHDLKGPFNRIFALVHILEMTADNLSHEQKEYIGKIHQIVVDGLGMIRNLLDRRRLNDKGIELTMEPINLSTHINTLVKNYRILSAMKNIEIAYTTAEKAVVLADRHYANRIFENLLSNALKFSPNDTKVFVEIKEENDEIIVSIKDEGPGISQEDQKLLYKQFQKLTAKPTGGESSTGLGLSIVKSVARHMGFEVACKSEEGEGATFFVKKEKCQLAPTGGKR